ncbi:unnamed protein product, partial [Dibothriocephalus latus]
MAENGEDANMPEEGKEGNTQDQGEHQQDVQSDEPNEADSGYSSAASSDVNSQTIPITVMLPNSEAVNLSFDPNMSVGKLKERLNGLSSTRLNENSVFIYSGKQLDPNKTLSDYKVQKSSTLYVHETPTALPKSAPNAKEEGVVPSNVGLQTVRILMPDGSTVEMHVAPGVTVGDLNSKIAIKQGVPPSSQCLIHSGSRMDDNRCLKEYHLPQNSVIFVHRPKANTAVQKTEGTSSSLEVTVRIRETGNQLRLPINPRSSNPMQELSKQIEAATQIPAQEQEVLFKGKSVGSGENLLQKKDFLKNPVVEVKRRMLDQIQIFLRNLQGQTKTILSKESATVRELKETVQEREGVLVRDQVLICQGQTLQDTRTLIQSGV